MLLWIQANLANILICVLLIAVVAAIVYGRFRSRKRGESSCGCGCAGCSKCSTKN